MSSDAEARVYAASRLEQSLVVTAGAGTGKTSLLVERVLHHVLERGTDLERIAAITFTVKAAAELRERIEDALQRIPEVLEGPRAESPRGEAGRVLARIRGTVADDVIAERARRAMDALDGASIGTIHSFTADLLRRRHALAGVDVGFEVDEGGAWLELFEEKWSEYVGRSLGADSDLGRWRPLLAKASLDDVERLAWLLAGYRFTPASLGEEGVEAQRAVVRRIATRGIEGARRIRALTLGAPGINRNLPGVIDRLEAIFSMWAESGTPCGIEEAGGLAKSVTIGKNAVLANAEEIEKAAKDLIRDARDLASSDPALIEDLGRAILPFIEELRSEFARQGYMSYDGLLALARDLLRDHPDVRREEGARFDHILLDEFQDTDPVQYEIVFFLAEGPGRPARDAFEARLVPGKLFIVGDAKQSIYRFRGADIGAYERAMEVIQREGGASRELRACFRSRPEIVEPLNDLFAGWFGMGPGGESDPGFERLDSHVAPAGEPRIAIWSVGEPGLGARDRRRAEARAVAAGVRTAIEGGMPRREIAILLRARTDLDALASALRDEDVDFVAEGGKGFFTRLEVELLIAFLRVFSNPADSISLVSCLRSPVCAVPDRELHLFAAQGGDRDISGKGYSIWSLRARPDPAAMPNLARALGMLRGFAERHERDPIDRMARAALEETPLRVAMAASHGGGQRVANLDKAVRHIAELAKEGLLTPSEIMDRIVEEDRFESSRGDSPLADEAVDAVRVLTVHMAKGLEWDMVVVPDLAAERRNPRSDEDAFASIPSGPGLPPALAIRLGESSTPALAEYRAAEKMERAAEDKRLLYVASTRARERLVLVVGPPRKGQGIWIPPLGAWGYDLEHGFPDAGSFHGGAIDHARCPRPESVRRGGGSAEPDEDIIRAAKECEEASRKAASAARPFSSPSGEDEPEPMDEEGVRAAPVLPRRRKGKKVDRVRDVAKAAGEALHLLLEAWDGKDPGWLDERAGAAARIGASKRGVDPEDVKERLSRILLEARRAGAIDAIAREPVLAREVPILLRAKDGKIYRGSVDRVCGSPGAPSIVDFKTDAAADDLQVLYAPQLSIYAEAVERAMGLPAKPEARIVRLGG